MIPRGDAVQEYVNNLLQVFGAIQLGHFLGRTEQQALVQFGAYHSKTDYEKNIHLVKYTARNN
jgi:hypothetical protein